MRLILLMAICLLFGTAALAGDADVVGAQVRKLDNQTFDFDVTVRSKDTGWSRYADRIEVLGMDGKILGQRELAHPHDDEQPFTRDVYGVKIPPGTARVKLRAHFKPSGYNGEAMEIDLPK